MKKIVSIVLALVLVLAIAAPAMAITGYVTPVTSATASAPFSGGISLVDSSAAGLGVLGLNAVASNRAYVANEVIYGRVDLVGNDKTSWNGNDYWETKLILSSNAATLLNAVAYEISSGASSVLLTGAPGAVNQVGAATANTATNTITWIVPDVKNYTVLFSGVVKEAQGTIVAELKGGNMEYFKGINGKLASSEYPIHSDLGVKLYGISKGSNNSVYVNIYDGPKGAETLSAIVEFARDAKNICTEIAVTAGGASNQVVKYTVPISNEGAVLESIGSYTAADKTGTFAALKAAYEQVMSFFGFDYNAKGELLDAHFTSKLHSFYAKDEVTVNLYTQAITVPDPDVEIPQTGDAATTIGFVMVAMAIVAAAAVAYKKVRA